ncbi:type III pantothenate kinase [Spiroplasma citri]|uniref:Type III pantothenate kinase n=1 Tax=Spiroplasma citri TaxID=2133 RepID=A0AAX3SX65_SPICI|nr:type III pantothenate kinase [Spiroplasma citri]WFG95813.1 type III pantothenate kinase [Spiroplasma citri]WFG99695.1 type III pantothenate kinase [Spiroplasma citri]
MKLLVDIGNTAIKFAIFNPQKKIIVFLTMASRELVAEKNFQQKIITGLSTIKLVLTDLTLLVLSSVRPMWDDLFYKLAVDLKIPFYQVKKNLATDRLKTEIPNPRNLGADLIVGSYATLALFPKQDVILVNMGTATTISLLKQDTLLGTIIMPGLETAAEALFERAQLLQKFDFSYDNAILGKNTKQAINIGLVNGHLLAIIAFVNQLATEVINPQVILTGGNATYIKKLVNYHYDKDLLFKGLVTILQDNKLI